MSLIDERYLQPISRVGKTRLKAWKFDFDPGDQYKIHSWIVPFPDVPHNVQVRGDVASKGISPMVGITDVSASVTLPVPAVEEASFVIFAEYTDATPEYYNSGELGDPDPDPVSPPGALVNPYQTGSSTPTETVSLTPAITLPAGSYFFIYYLIVTNDVTGLTGIQTTGVLDVDENGSTISDHNFQVVVGGDENFVMPTVVLTPNNLIFSTDVTNNSNANETYSGTLVIHGST